jgi:adenine-specific DNA-methyltransferase
MPRRSTSRRRSTRGCCREPARHRARRRAEPELTLFDGFDGLNELDMVEFYQHEANWSNRMILGDSLQVMGSLAEREGLRGKVQMIYIDPPYGIKFGSNWQVSTRKRDVKDGKLRGRHREAEQIKAFRDTWELGIHSYLTYLRDRLMVASDLLTESRVAASSRSATKTSTSCGASWTRSSAARTS